MDRRQRYTRNISRDCDNPRHSRSGPLLVRVIYRLHHWAILGPSLSFNEDIYKTKSQNETIQKVDIGHRDLIHCSKCGGRWRLTASDPDEWLGLFRLLQEASSPCLHNVKRQNEIPLDCHQVCTEVDRQGRAADLRGVEVPKPQSVLYQILISAKPDSSIW